MSKDLIFKLKNGIIVQGTALAGVSAADAIVKR